MKKQSKCYNKFNREGKDATLCMIPCLWKKASMNSFFFQKIIKTKVRSKHRSIQTYMT